MVPTFIKNNLEKQITKEAIQNKDPLRCFYSAIFHTAKRVFLKGYKMKENGQKAQRQLSFLTMTQAFLLREKRFQSLIFTEDACKLLKL